MTDRNDIDGNMQGSTPADVLGDGHVTPFELTRGRYRNKIGGELVVLWPVRTVREFKTLGSIWEAEAPDSLFGATPYLVTRESLISCGYSLIERTPDVDL